MTTIVYAHELFGLHETPDGHPERAARIPAVLDALSGADLPLEWRKPGPAPRDALLAVHPPHYLKAIERAVPETGMVALDGDTVAGPHSLKAALHATGACLEAVDAVMDGAHNAFVAARPPGHHAERAHAMGFCLVNHIAAAARYAQRAHGLSRVAVIDFDVHHGNGTQDIFSKDGSVMYLSTHQWPLFPGTGAADERGVGNIVNCPLSPSTDGAAARHAFNTKILPALDDFRPEFVLLSAGFDAHEDDPLGSLYWSVEDYVWITARMMEVANAHAKGRLVSLLEGGYDLAALAASARAHVTTLASAPVTA